MAPPQEVLNGCVGARSCCSLQGRDRGGVAVGAQQGEAVEQQVEGTWRTRRWREGPDRAADLREDLATGEMSAVRRGAPGGQVGLARELQVKGLEPPVTTCWRRSPVSTYRLVNVPANPSGRCGAPETEPGPSGVGDEFMRSPFHPWYCLTVAHGAGAPRR